MSDQANVQEVAGTETVKASGKGKKYFIHTSKKGTRPLNDVWKEEDGKMILIEGLSEAERIKEGIYPPYQRKPDFKKDLFERKEWRRLHTNKKMKHAANSSGFSYHGPAFRLIVHVENKEKVNTYKTTYSYDARQSEIGSILKSLAEQGEVVKRTLYRGVRTDY